MNAVIALCHFCEAHGPAVVICTQPYSNKASNSQIIIPVFDKLTFGEITTYIPPNKLYYMHEPSHRSGVMNASRLPLCRSCTSIGSDGCPYISNDHVKKKTYMSCQKPEDLALTTRLKYACIKSLTSEKVDEENEPKFIGNDAHGHVFSYPFKLHNFHARGLRSIYSIIVLSKDKMTLVNLWPFLVPNIKHMINELQKSAELVFMRDQTLEKTREIPLPNFDLHPTASIRTMSVNKEPRSLISITREDTIFTKIHAWFTWLLRAGDEVFIEWYPVSGDGRIDLSCFGKGERADLDLQRSVVNLLELYKILGPAQFTNLVFHTVIGNQVIVRSTSCALSTCVIKALNIFLPRGCVSGGYSKESYKQLFEFNLLALDSKVPLPLEVTGIDAAPCAVLLINFLSKDSHKEFKKNHLIVSNDISLRMDSSKPPMTRKFKFFSKIPRVVEQYVKFINNPFNLGWKCVLTNLEVTRNEWFSKTKLYYAFKRKQIESRASDVELHDKLIDFIRNIGIASDSDHAVVKFWLRGLDDDLKKTVNSTLREGASKN